MPRARAFLATAALAISALATPATAQSPYRLPQASLQIGQHGIDAEVASTEAQRSRGLMHRQHMQENHGMLFVFEMAAQYCFWMKDTLIPLTIAFIDDDGRIVDLADMQPRDETHHHCPSRPARMALEMNQGWFKARGIGPGSRIEGLPGTAPASGAEAAGSGKGAATPPASTPTAPPHGKTPAQAGT